MQLQAENSQLKSLYEEEQKKVKLLEFESESSKTISEKVEKLQLENSTLKASM